MRTEVHVDKGTGDVVVDTNTVGGIARNSLALGAAGTVFCLRDGRPQSTSLRP